MSWLLDGFGKYRTYSGHVKAIVTFLHALRDGTLDLSKTHALPIESPAGIWVSGYWRIISCVDWLVDPLIYKFNGEINSANWIREEMTLTCHSLWFVFGSKLLIRPEETCLTQIQNTRRPDFGSLLQNLEWLSLQQGDGSGVGPGLTSWFDIDCCPPLPNLDGYQTRQAF